VKHSGRMWNTAIPRIFWRKRRAVKQKIKTAASFSWMSASPDLPEGIVEILRQMVALSGTVSPSASPEAVDETGGQPAPDGSAPPAEGRNPESEKLPSRI
jgi:hypothetical protein